MYAKAGHLSTVGLRLSTRIFIFITRRRTCMWRCPENLCQATGERRRKSCQTIYLKRMWWMERINAPRYHACTTKESTLSTVSDLLLLLVESPPQIKYCHFSKKRSRGSFHTFLVKEKFKVKTPTCTESLSLVTLFFRVAWDVCNHSSSYVCSLSSNLHGCQVSAWLCLQICRFDFCPGSTIYKLLTFPRIHWSLRPTSGAVLERSPSCKDIQKCWVLWAFIIHLYILKIRLIIF